MQWALLYLTDGASYLQPPLSAQNACLAARLEDCSDLSCFHIFIVWTAHAQTQRVATCQLQIVGTRSFLCRGSAGAAGEVQVWAEGGWHHRRQGKHLQHRLCCGPGEPTAAASVVPLAAVLFSSAPAWTPAMSFATSVHLNEKSFNFWSSLYVQHAAEFVGII